MKNNERIYITVDENEDRVLFAVRFPNYVDGADDNGKVWDIIETAADELGIVTKDGYLHGRIGTSEYVKAEKGFRWFE